MLLCYYFKVFACREFMGPLLSGVFTSITSYTTASILIGEIILAEVT